MPAPSNRVDADCLIKILRGHGMQVQLIPGIPDFAFLLRGDALPWPIPTAGALAQAEIRALFEVAGLDVTRLENYRKRFCEDPRGPRQRRLN